MINATLSGGVRQCATAAQRSVTAVALGLGIGGLKERQTRQLESAKQNLSDAFGGDLQGTTDTEEEEGRSHQASLNLAFSAIFQGETWNNKEEKGKGVTKSPFALAYLSLKQRHG